MPVRLFTLVTLTGGMAAGVLCGVAAFWLMRDGLPGASGAAALPHVVRHVRDAYVEPIAEEELVESAILGILDGLDKHSAYLGVDEVDFMREEHVGHFGGIGIRVSVMDGYITVVAPMEDMPAAKAGLRAGDAIIAVDGQTLKGQTLRRIVASLRGEPGSAVTLEVRRQGEAQPFSVELERAIIPIRTVRSRLIEPGYGYLRISDFQRRTAEDVRAALESLAEDAGAGLKGLVMDLRDNPGGVLGASVDVADAFLEAGTIVYTKGRGIAADHRFEASGEDLLQGAPIAVLIDRGSASASEILAGALQDHGRAVLIGTRSYGKGSVQSVLPLGNSRALKLTTARYYTPDGRAIAEAGIDPDVALPAAAGASAEEYETLLLAEALRRLKRPSAFLGKVAAG